MAVCVEEAIAALHNQGNRYYYYVSWYEGKIRMLPNWVGRNEKGTVNIV